MAGRDGRGPNGAGSRTGRGLGNCAPHNGETTGWGFGRGMGAGRGRGFGRGVGNGAWQYAPFSDAEKEAKELKEKVAQLEKEVEELKK